MSEKNYFIAKQSDFEAFVAGQTASSTLKAAATAVAEGVNSGAIELTDEDPIVIFERTNTVRKTKPRPVTEGLVVESNRKLGPRPKKEKAPAVETPAAESAATE
jgi:hypothetical protein